MTNEINISAPISVLIPNFNGKELLSKHLPRVLAAMRSNDELIIVDDASTDDSVEWLKNAFSLTKAEVEPDIHDLPEKYHPDVNEMKFEVLFGKFQEKAKRIRVMVISNPENLRFAASVNLGFALASNRLVFLLNNDVSPNQDVIEKLLSFFEDEEVFGVGCMEYEQSIDGEKSGKNKLWFEKGVFRHSKSEEFSTGETAWVSGGSGLFDREKWLDLGGYDKSFYPAYWEDVDISFRAKKWGWKCLFSEEAVVFHQHESTNTEVFGQETIDKISWKHADTFSWKNGNPVQKLLHLLWKPYWMWKRY